MKHLKEININNINENETTFYANFDWENYMETDLNGASIEMMIDQLIEEAKQRINDTIPNTRDNRNLLFGAKSAIKKLWKSKIDNWK
jgi:hypothetical protein